MMASFKLRETERVFQAKITLVAGAADPASHMVRVTGEVVQEAHKYWLRPGSFCDVTVDIAGARDVVAVPRSAVRPSERGFLAYVIEDGVAHERKLALGMNTRDGWVEVREGLAAGEKLVIRGAEPLSDGAKVTAKDATPPASSGFVSASAAPAVDPPPAASASASSSSSSSGGAAR
jgi:RND family efflux transporter MFP subunit